VVVFLIIALSEIYC